MTAKEYLSKIQIYRRAILSTQLRIEELEHQASGIRAITYDRDKVQASPENRIEDIMIRVDALTRKMTRQIMKYQTEVTKREKQIADMERAEYAQVLQMKYIDGMNLLQITLAMRDADGGQRYSYDHVKHMHGWALNAFQKKYLNNTK